MDFSLARRETGKVEQLVQCGTSCPPAGPLMQLPIFPARALVLEIENSRSRRNLEFHSGSRSNL